MLTRDEFNNLLFHEMKEGDTKYILCEDQNVFNSQRMVVHRLLQKSKEQFDIPPFGISKFVDNDLIFLKIERLKMQERVVYEMVDGKMVPTELKDIAKDNTHSDAMKNAIKWARNHYGPDAPLQVVMDAAAEMVKIPGSEEDVK